MSKALLTIIAVFCFVLIQSQSNNVARDINKILLKAITNDVARPTVHARNLYHLSAMTYDIYAVYYDKETYFLGKEIKGYQIPFDGKPSISDTLTEMKEAICFASLQFIKHRFQNSPGAGVTFSDIDNYLLSLGYDISNSSTNYISGGAAEFGNYVAEQIISYGLQDGSNEANDYANTFYQPTNPPLVMEDKGNPDIVDPNKWQAIDVPNALDQAGNPISGVPPHLSPEWGNVNTFSLHDSLKTQEVINGDNYNVFCDPGDPAYIDTTDTSGLDSFYKWNFCMVPIWQSHLDPSDGVAWDISPNSIGNLPMSYPNNNEDIDTLYDYYDGGHAHEQGYSVNPKTGQPYDVSIVRRADYARVLAEFWADGLDSETPPGHWFKIYHEISEHPDFEFKWMGQGDELDTMFYDILAQFTLGGMMHDAAVAAWSIKGRYDYVRPASAIRYMADKGQCSDPNDLSYHEAGLPIIPNYIELVYPGDPLAGQNNENVGKMKLYTWRGPDYIPNPEVDFAGVDWILAENWWPYQRPTFVTPPFAGYISGHSTFSTTAAEVLTLITGDPFFPGGLSDFEVMANEFLEFENGPSNTFKLQWSTYRDAANQCSLSRIWGGIHPPVDDIPGRIIGQKIGPLGTAYADSIISIEKPRVYELDVSDSIVNKSKVEDTLVVDIIFSHQMDINQFPDLTYVVDDPLQNSLTFLTSEFIDDSTFRVEYEIMNSNEELFEIVLQIDSALALNGKYINKSNFKFPFVIDLIEPQVVNSTPSTSVISQPEVNNNFYLDIHFSEICDTTHTPSIEFIAPVGIQNTLINLPSLEHWLSDSVYQFAFEVEDNDEFIQNIEYTILNVFDIHENEIDSLVYNADYIIDTESPNILDITSNKSIFNRSDIGFQTVEFEVQFSKPMDTLLTPSFTFPGTNAATILTNNPFLSEWEDEFTFKSIFNLENSSEHIFQIPVKIQDVSDTNDNNVMINEVDSVFSIDTKKPIVISSTPSNEVVFDGNVGNNGFYVDVLFSEKMNLNEPPLLTLSHPSAILSSSITYNPFSNEWLNDSTARCFFNINDENIEVDSLFLTVDYAKDYAGNYQSIFLNPNFIDLDTRNPKIIVFNATSYHINNFTNSWESVQIFDEPMDENYWPKLNFTPIAVSSILDIDSTESFWINETTFNSNFYVTPSDTAINDVDVEVFDAKDLAGNLLVTKLFDDFLDLELSNLSTSNEIFNEVKVFPNPVNSNGEIYIQFSKPIDLTKIELTDNLGRTIKYENIKISDSHFSFKIPNIDKGTYFLRLEREGSKRIQKLIIY